VSSRNLENEEAMAHIGPQRHRKKKKKEKEKEKENRKVDYNDGRKSSVLLTA